MNNQEAFNKVCAHDYRNIESCGNLYKVEHE